MAAKTGGLFVCVSEHQSLSEEMLKRCDFTVKIPMKFSINVGMAIVLYDRFISLGGYPPRPITAGGPQADIPPPHRWGAPMVRKGR